MAILDYVVNVETMKTELKNRSLTNLSLKKSLSIEFLESRRRFNLPFHFWIRHDRRKSSKNKLQVLINFQIVLPKFRIKSQITPLHKMYLIKLLEYVQVST